MLKLKHISRARWYTSVIPALGRLRQKHPKFEGSLGYIVKDPVSKTKTEAGCWWLTPVILAPQEAEIRRLSIESQPRQLIHEPLPRKYSTQNRSC
jgi:hypothetical protein